MKRIFFVFLGLLGLSLPVGVAAEYVPETQPREQVFILGRILSIQEATLSDQPSYATSTAEVELLQGTHQGSVVQVDLPTSNDPAYQFSIGETVVVTEVQGYSGILYYITDRYRLPSLYWVLGVFVVFILMFSRWRGLTSLIGLGVSVAVIVWFVVPRILAGDSPLLVSILASAVILFVSIYLAHGFHWRTSVAVLSTLITLALTASLAFIGVEVAELYGLGSEEVLSLQITQLSGIDFRGLLLGGMILGALGVLDDITTAQAAAIQQLKEANRQLTFTDLVKRGLKIGQEHITSLVNTLFLAYAGASLPVFLFFTVIPDVPAWVHLNSEFVAEELMRTLVGSIGLILAVPLTTVLAAYVFTRRTWGEKQVLES